MTSRRHENWVGSVTTSVRWLWKRSDSHGRVLQINICPPFRRLLMLWCPNSATNTNKEKSLESPSIFFNRQCLHERTHAHTSALTNAYTHVALYMNNALYCISVNCPPCFCDCSNWWKTPQKIVHSTVTESLVTFLCKSYQKYTILSSHSFSAHSTVQTYSHYCSTPWLQLHALLTFLFFSMLF